MLYDQDNPYDADVQLTMPDGSTATFVLTPMGLVMLMRQLDEVRTAQRQMQHVIDGGDPNDFDVTAAGSLFLDNQGVPPAMEGSAAGGRESNAGGVLPQWVEQLDHKGVARRAVDPASLSGLLDMMPPIGGHSGKSVVTIAVLAALMLSAFVGIVLV